MCYFWVCCCCCCCFLFFATESLSIARPHWPQIYGPPASASQVWDYRCAPLCLVVVYVCVCGFFFLTVDYICLFLCIILIFTIAHCEQYSEFCLISDWGLSSEIHTCKAGALMCEPQTWGQTWNVGFALSQWMLQMLKTRLLIALLWQGLIPHNALTPGLACCNLECLLIIPL
jgi:hypothetical protein